MAATKKERAKERGRETHSATITMRRVSKTPLLGKEGRTDGRMMGVCIEDGGGGVE